MKLNIQKWGNSAAIRLPAAMLSEIGATVGDTVEVDTKAFRLTKPSYKLSDLLGQCDSQAAPPVDAAEWESAAPVGNELL